MTKVDTDFPDFDELVKDIQTSDIPSSSSGESSNGGDHVKGCRCEACGPHLETRGRHPKGCMCETCDRENQSIRNFHDSFKGLWKMCGSFFDARFSRVQGYQPISDSEIKVLADATDDVAKKYTEDLKYIEEATLALAVIGIFGSRIAVVMNAAKQKKSNRNSSGEKGIGQDDVYTENAPAEV